MSEFNDAEATMVLGEDYPEIRAAVHKLCEGFPASYWQGLEGQPPETSYPTEFINALTAAGYLGALIPEEYGGAGLPLRAACVILEVIHSTAASAAAAHAQMYTMGTILRHGSEEQKRQYLPRIASGELRLQAFGVTEPSTGSDTTQLRTRADRIDGGYRINGQKV
ncbi:MAG: acyl-CoA/acyl-ACP dehydrogenase, partial [Chromatiales bacterium]|nr:acyl-CoA/acyl-ACP dehydrogenase [Chromatiales bacterium]